MEQGKSLLKNTLIYAIGNFGSKILSFLLLPLYTYYLTKDEFGIYDLVIASISLMVPIITIQSSDSTYRWLLDNKDDKKKQAAIITNGFVIITSIMGGFYIIYFIASHFISYNYTGYFSLVLLSISYLPFFQQILRGLDKNKLYAASGIINTVLVLACNICFLAVFKFKLESLFLATIISNVLTIIFIGYSIKITSYFSLKLMKLKEMKSMIAYSLPLVPNTISWWLINVADKYIILYFLTIEANGIYALSTRFPAIINLVNSIFLMAWQDHGITAKDNEEGRAFFSKIFDQFIVLEMTIIIFLISISKFLVEFFVNKEFFESWKYLPFLFIGVAFSAFSAYIGVGYQRTKRTRHIFTTTLIGGAINVAISILFLRSIGLYAPAIGTFISSLAMYMIRKHQTNSFFKIEVNNIKLFALTALAFIYSFVALYCNLTINLISIVIAIFLIFYLNKSLIKDGLGMLNARFVKNRV